LARAEQGRERTQQHPRNDPRAQCRYLTAGKMFACVAQHVSVPEHLLVAERQLVHTVPAAVAETRRRAIDDLATAFQQPLAEIDILEPHGKELLVETANRLPSRSCDCEARPGWLLNFLLL
jgi:hypothetical protein